LTARADPAGGLLATAELLGGLGILIAFAALLLAPAAVRVVGEVPWILGALPTPQFGINPHYGASARYLPSLAVLVTCAALPLCYRCLASRRQD
jgi:hypothetical protein